MAASWKLTHGSTAKSCRLAFRNKAMPLEALRYDETPTGIHYSLIHYDIPLVDLDEWRLTVAGTDGAAAWAIT
jgi:hypothetical protein